MNNILADSTGGGAAQTDEALVGELLVSRLRDAMLGLGSTYRTLGEYKKSVDLLRRGMFRFRARPRLQRVAAVQRDELDPALPRAAGHRRAARPSFINGSVRATDMFLEL